MLEIASFILLAAAATFSVVESVAEARAARWLPSGVSAAAGFGCVALLLLLVRVA